MWQILKYVGAGNNHVIGSTQSERKLGKAQKRYTEK